MTTRSRHAFSVRATLSNAISVGLSLSLDRSTAAA
jgi:hypothetical protein